MLIPGAACYSGVGDAIMDDLKKYSNPSYVAPRFDDEDY